MILGIYRDYFNLKELRRLETSLAKKISNEENFIEIKEEFGKTAKKIKIFYNFSKNF